MIGNEPGDIPSARYSVLYYSMDNEKISIPEATIERIRPSESILRCGAKWVSVSAEIRVS